MLILVPYLAVAVFVVAVVARWVKIARMPVHLRWELYPVAHEPNAGHGGSFFEHLDWWKRRPAVNRAREIKVMMPEMLMLSGVRAYDRALWLRTYPFHLGLYLSAGFLGLLLVGGLLVAGVIPSREGLACPDEAVGPVLQTATTLAGVAGMVLLGLGAFALLLRRLKDPALRAHSAPADFANLIFFFGAASLGLVTFVVVDRDFSILRGFVATALTWGSGFDMPALVVAEIVVASALFAYIPLTHMSHFFTKWFMYHDIRWNDEVNRVGSPLEAAIGRQLAHKVSWNAPHIRGDGKKTWVDVATEEVGKS